MFLLLIHNILHLINIKETLSYFQNSRSINKGFEAYKEFSLSLKFNFSIAWFSETWANDINIKKALLFNYQITILNIRLENQAVEEVHVSLFMNHTIIR